MQVLVLNLHISTLTQILQNMNGFTPPKSIVLNLPTLLLVDSQDVYTLLSPSLHSQCAVVLSHNGIAKVLGLPDYVANTTKSWTQQAYNERALINTGGALRQDSVLDASKESARSQINFMIII